MKKNKIKLSLIKKLREITQVGLLDCKSALISSKGNIKLAIENIRKSGKKVSMNKSIYDTKEGIIIIHMIKNKILLMLEINCQTDFVAKTSILNNFGKKIISYMINYNEYDINNIKLKFEEEKKDLIFKLGENININRLGYIKGKELGYYLHNNMKIGVIVSVRNMDQNLTKKIAMHIAASKPEYINSKDISEEKINKEKEIQLEIATKINRNKEIVTKIVQGRIEKFMNKISLVNQKFIFDAKKTIKEILKKENSKIISFIRFEIGF